MLLQESSSHFLIWVPPRPQPTQESPGWAGTSALCAHVVLIKQAGMPRRVSQCILVTPADLELQEDRGPPCCLLVATQVIATPVPRARPQQILLSEREGCGKARRRSRLRPQALPPREGAEARAVQEGKAGNVCRNGTCKTGSGQIHSDGPWSSRFTEPADILRTAGPRRVPGEAGGERPARASRGRSLHRRHWAGRGCQGEFCGPLGSRQLGLF